MDKFNQLSWNLQTQVTMPQKNFAVNWTSIYDSWDWWTIENYTVVKKYKKNLQSEW